MYSNPCESAPLGLAWLPYQWRVNSGVPHIERPGQLCELVGHRHDAADQLFFRVRFSDGHESEYLPGDLIAAPVWGAR